MAKKKCVRIISDDLSLSVSLSFVANVSPSVSALEETLSTLKFAQRAKTVKNTSSVQEETIGSVQALQQELRRAKAELLRLQSEGCAAGDALGKVVENLDEESRNHLDKVRSLLASERDAHQEERGRLAAEVESLRGLAKKLETSLKSTKLVVRLREQNLERLQGKLPPAPAEFWREQGGAAIRENEELKVQLECHPEVVKCRMEIEQLGRENGRLKERLEQEVESQIFVFKENAKTAMEELHFLIKDREALQTEHNQLSAEHDRLKEDNFLDLQGAFDKLEATMNANEDLKGKNERAGQEAGKLRDEVAALEAALEEATRTIERTRRAYEEVQADLAAHAKMCDELSDNVMEITNRLSTMQKQKETVEASFETLKSEMDAQKEAHNNECTQLSDQIQTVQQEKESVEANMESLKSEIAAKTQAHNDECTELNGQIKTIQQEKETVEASFETLKSEMDAQKEAHNNECTQLSDQIQTVQQEKQSVEAKLAALKSDVAAQREASNRSRADEAKILELESALAKARQAEAELKMKTRESLSSCNTAMEEVKKLEAESSRARKTEEDLEDKLREAEGELQRFKRLYAESQQERQDLERERSSLASQLDSECEKRQAAIMAKVQSESKLSEAREEARESADQLREDLEEASADRERLRRRVRELEIDVARSQSPSTPANDENRIARSASLMLGSAQRRPFGDASNRIKSIELTPQGKEQRSKQGEKTRQLHKVKAHLSAIESAISSRSSSRYALRTRNRVTYKE